MNILKLIVLLGATLAANAKEKKGAVKKRTYSMHQTGFGSSEGTALNEYGVVLNDYDFK